MAKQASAGLSPLQLIDGPCMPAFQLEGLSWGERQALTNEDGQEKGEGGRRGGRFRRDVSNLGGVTTPYAPWLWT